MVLNNYECWANGSASEFDPLNGVRQLNPFDPHTVSRSNPAPGEELPAPVSQIVSNGYYGFSYVNAVHVDLNNNNNNNNNICNNNLFQANGVNDKTSSVTAVVRCKKRAHTSGAEAAKRCRFDDGDAAEHCNDFFSLRTPQIGTQSCLMETEEGGELNAAAVDTTYLQSSCLSNSQCFPQRQEKEQQQQESALQVQQSSPFQGHLHRSNRDVSRCLLSHMI